MTSDVDYLYIDPLTNREMEVLQHLADGLSNQEIADTLVIEVSTVKWYNRQIYSKLDVNNRKQAVIRAHTLGILELTTNNPFLPKLHNLPNDVFPFIGREPELSDLSEKLTHENLRLITILAPGGMGKSRLATEVGWQLLGHFRDGVYFVSLAPVTSSQEMITTIADVIGFTFHDNTPAQEQLLSYLQSQNMLLIADNFEHLLDHAALLTDILKAAPSLKILVTSREKLGLRGELPYVISGLSIPYEHHKDASPHDAVQLFIEAAKHTTSPVHEDELSIVARICRILGGMPLAILLAAAWLDTLSLAEIETELKSGLDILEAKLRDAPPRHQSIETVFDYSWEWLTNHEQEVFMCLSVFRGGFTREAAKVVAGASIRDLQRLVHTSFIQHTSSGRYTIHELMRQYGEHKLEQSGESDTVRRKHAQFFAECIRPLAEVSWGVATTEMLEQVNADYENIRVAWQFLVEQQAIDELRVFLDGLWMFFDQYSRTQEGIDMFDPLLAIFADNRPNHELFRAQLLARLAWFYSDTGQPQRAVETGKTALETLKRFDSYNDMLLIYQMLNLALAEANQFQESSDYLIEGFDLSIKIDNQKWFVSLGAKMVGLYCHTNNYEEAEALLDSLPDHKYSNWEKPAILYFQGKYAEAEEVILNSLDKYHMHRIDYILRFCDLTHLASQRNNFEQAWCYIQQGIQYGDDSNYAWGALMIVGMALRLHLINQKYIIVTEWLSLMMHHPRTTARERARVAKFEDELRMNLSPDAFEAAWERGKHLDLGDVITDLMER